jgi:hypothetical protein
MMTAPDPSSTTKPHDMLRSGFAGAILGATLVGAVALANHCFSLSLRAEPNLFHVQVTSGTAPSKLESTVRAL